MQLQKQTVKVTELEVRAKNFTQLTENAFHFLKYAKVAFRNGDIQTKKEIIQTYDKNLGYSIESLPRTDFKIDHYIPLCMGGDNEKENLWPQNKSVYTVTDPLEQESCEKMAQGKLLQAKAIELIKKAKNHLDQVAEIRAYVHSL